jgi:hypothetical protein
MKAPPPLGDQQIRLGLSPYNLACEGCGTGLWCGERFGGRYAPAVWCPYMLPAPLAREAAQASPPPQAVHMRDLRDRVHHNAHRRKVLFERMSAKGPSARPSGRHRAEDHCHGTQGSVEVMMPDGQVITVLWPASAARPDGYAFRAIAADAALGKCYLPPRGSRAQCLLATVPASAVSLITTPPSKTKPSLGGTPGWVVWSDAESIVVSPSRVPSPPEPWCIFRKLSDCMAQGLLRRSDDDYPSGVSVTPHSMLAR